MTIAINQENENTLLHHEEIANTQLNTELPGKEIKELAGKGPGTQTGW